MVGKNVFYFVALLLFVASCHAQDVFQGANGWGAKDDLKDFLLARYDDIEISEIFSKKSDKTNYLKKSLGHLFVKSVLDVKSQDFYFKELSAVSAVHLGVAYCRYETPEKAREAMSRIEQKGFFENTKIATRYVAINSGVVNLIVYTESSGNKTVIEYLDSIPQKILNAQQKN
ncbi:MAG: hypothetical protein B0W54_11510 [Cellvibrio sp. 79]|nr:MAG: hypothetical protein B0W54_11510 [Cellvibrio sp. 79]